MECIRDLVDVKYHELIKKDQPDLDALLSQRSCSLKPGAICFTN